jgi:hypothetical protein
MFWFSRSKAAGRGAFVLAAAVVVLAVQASAQTVPAPASASEGRVELAAGFGWLGAVALGERDGALRGNASPAEPFRLFSSETRLAGAPSVDGRVTVALNPRYGVEGRVAYARPELRTSLSADFEHAPPLTATEAVSEFLVEGGIAVRLTGVRAARMSTFVTGGAGYRRQLHDGRTFIEESTVYYAGGGLRRVFLSRPQGALRSVGWRAEGRLYLLSGGAFADEGVRPRPAAGASIFVTF